MNLVLTPYWKAQDKLDEMMEALDKHSHLPFYHVIIGDNDFPTILKKYQKPYRYALVRSYNENPDFHTNQEGEALQEGLDWARAYLVDIEYIFLIENDVMVREGWDEKMIAEAKELPDDWATLDVTSLEPFEGGYKVGYPTVINVPIDKEGKFFVLDYTDFQSTLFNPEVWKLDWKFNTFPSHFDILISRRIRELSGRRHFRTPNIEVIHYPSSSRKFLPNQ